MLSTTHTLICPTCGQPATIRVHTVRHRRNAPRTTFTPDVTFVCRRGCVLAEDKILELSGEEAGV